MDIEPARPEALPSASELDRADMAELANGRENALDRLMARHAGKLFHYLIRQLQNEAEAEDITQETFVRVFQNARRFNPAQKFSSWLYAIATNLVKDRFRYRSRHPHISVELEDSSEQTLLSKLADARQSSPAEQMQASECALAVQHALAELPEELRTPLILFEYEGLAQGEIAEILACTAKAVENRIYRARKALRSLLEPFVRNTL